MAVFTPVQASEASQLLKDYDLGELVSLTGISAGIENSNFFLTTTHGEYVLTVFEVLEAAQLPFYVELMHHLASRGVPVPMPQTRSDGVRISTLHGKPSIIVTRLAGAWVREPTAAHCEIAARTMAQTHLAGHDFAIQQPNLRGLAWWKATAPKVMNHLTEDQRALLTRSLRCQIDLDASGALKTLPRGPVHCDFFRDNVLFAGTLNAPQMGGVIDFYFAGCDYWLFDLAVAINDWCVTSTGEIDPQRLQAWMRGYTSIRPFEQAERDVWPQMLQAAALRFWISRLFDFYNPRPAETLKPHDPTQFERILRLRSDGPIEPLAEKY